MIKGHFINLDKNADRRDMMQNQIAAFGLGIERFPAVNGREMDAAAFDAFVAARPHNSNPWTRGQVGCFLSHYALWEKAAASDAPYTVIFEDDITMSPSVSDFLSGASWIPADADVVRLEFCVHRVRLDKKAAARHAGRDVRKVVPCDNVRFWATATGAYIISKKAAQKIVALPPDRHMCVDVMLMCGAYSRLAYELQIYQVQPAPCKHFRPENPADQDKIFASDINTPEDIATVHSGCKTKAGFFGRKLETARYILKGYRKVPFKD